MPVHRRFLAIHIAPIIHQYPFIHLDRDRQTESKVLVQEHNMHNDEGAQPGSRDSESSEWAIDQAVPPLKYNSMVHNVQGSHCWYAA